MEYFPTQPMNDLPLDHMATFDVERPYLPSRAGSLGTVEVRRGKLSMAVSLRVLFSILHPLTSVLLHL